MRYIYNSLSGASWHRSLIEVDPRHWNTQKGAHAQGHEAAALTRWHCCTMSCKKCRELSITVQKSWHYSIERWIKRVVWKVKVGVPSQLPWAMLKHHHDPQDGRDSNEDLKVDKSNSLSAYLRHGSLSTNFWEYYK